MEEYEEIKYDEIEFGTTKYKFYDKYPSGIESDHIFILFKVYPIKIRYTINQYFCYKDDTV